MTRRLHPADRLAALRQQIATLQAEAAECERWLHQHRDDRDDLRGEEFEVSIFFNRVFVSRKVTENARPT